LSSEERKEALAKLQRYFAKVDAQGKPVSEAEEEEIINEALRSTPSTPSIPGVVQPHRRGSPRLHVVPAKHRASRGTGPTLLGAIA
jgi:hypothetical protein